MAKSRPFIINEMLRLKELNMVEYPKNSKRSQSILTYIKEKINLVQHRLLEKWNNCFLIQ